MSLSINRPTTPRNLIAAAVAWMLAGNKVAMLTLVAIEGSAPYPLGSQMLVNQRGDYLGQITGGCAEVALAQQAAKALNDGENRTQRYGLNSPFFDIQLPCGSGIDVFIDVATSMQEYAALDNKLESRLSVSQSLDTELGTFNKVYRPNERLIAFGQGPILRSLCELAVATGFEVICIAQQSDIPAQQSNLTKHASETEPVMHKGVPLHQTKLESSKFQAGQAEFVDYCDEYTAVVSLFHEHEHETKLLNKALATKAFYIGALGSRATHAARLQALQESGLEASQLQRIHGPVGLDIQSETPAQIAISILAQLVQKLPKESAQPVTLRSTNNG